MTDLTIDRIISLVAFAVLLGFLSILVMYVTRWDLGIVVLITAALAGWDFWSKMRPGKNTPEERPQQRASEPGA